MPYQLGERRSPTSPAHAPTSFPPHRLHETAVSKRQVVCLTPDELVPQIRKAVEEQYPSRSGLPPTPRATAVAPCCSCRLSCSCRRSAKNSMSATPGPNHPGPSEPPRFAVGVWAGRGV